MQLTGISSQLLASQRLIVKPTRSIGKPAHGPAIILSYDTATMATVQTIEVQERSGSFRSPSLALPFAVAEPSALYAVQMLRRRGQQSTGTANIVIWSDEVFPRIVLVYRRESPLMAESLEPEQRRTKQRPEHKKNRCQQQ